MWYEVRFEWGRKDRTVSVSYVVEANTHEQTYVECNRKLHDEGPQPGGYLVIVKTLLPEEYLALQKG